MSQVSVQTNFNAYLIWRCWERDGNTGTGAIVLHGWGSRLEKLQPIANELLPGGQVFAAEAPREVHSYTASPSIEDKGCYWFNTSADRRAEPLRFTDSLWRLEAFLIDIVRCRGPGAGPLYLIGEGQGADMALALAVTAPEFLSGVIAVAPGVQEFPGWSPPESEQNGLPILVWPRDDLSSPLIGILACRGANLTEIREILPPTWIGRLPTIKQWLQSEIESASKL